ncbi:hypothetical protein SAMN06295933_0896 [Desulfovibrio gilichinskyi]|uniref:Uncharacterized protein n=1 Tax=Desulfovibrio gilichinskyi TaxID=1519643 RepID=A0A1X7CI60_9BACT|nr:hypothetical protein SAMN06295933_0896 [Desulfovibrio gilichinskyi]
MDEIFKTKVGFTVTLLAVIFTIKPLIDQQASLGFTIFDSAITISYAYNTFALFLCLSVYCISLQFLVPASVLLPKLINTFYAVALSTPLFFVFFGVLLLHLIG